MSVGKGRRIPAMEEKKRKISDRQNKHEEYDNNNQKRNRVTWWVLEKKERRIKACNENKSKAGKRRKRVLKIKAGKK